jgi:hypothetical protein
MRWMHTGLGPLIPAGYHFNQLVCGAYCVESDRLFMVDGGAQFDGFFVVWEIDPTAGVVIAAHRLYNLTAIPDSSVNSGPSIILNSSASAFKFTGVGQTLNSRDTWLSYARQGSNSFIAVETPFAPNGGGQGVRVGSGVFMTLLDATFPTNKYIREFDLDLEFVTQYDVISSGAWALAYDSTRELFLVGFNGPDAITYSLVTGVVQTLVNLTAVTQWRRAYYNSDRFILFGASDEARFFTWNGVDYDAETPLSVLAIINSSCPIVDGSKIAVMGEDGGAVRTLAVVDMATMAVDGSAATGFTQNDILNLDPAGSEVALFNSNEVQIWDASSLTLLQAIASP